MQLNSLHSSWLRGQKITEKILEDFNIYSTNDNRIAFPIYDINGNFIFNKYRRSPEEFEGSKYTYDKGGKVTLYGMNKAKDFDTILITEGEKDCLVAWSHNIPAVTSTGGAMSFQEDWVELLKDKNIILCFDNDKAGGEGMAKVTRMFGLNNVRIIFLPDRAGVKDISDYVTNGGDIHALMKTAQRIESVNDNRSERLSLWKNTYFHDAWLNQEKAYTNTYKPKKDISDQIQRAKQYPMTDLLSIPRNNKINCMWHNERSASLHYYGKSNNFYCFGCGKIADTIEVYMKLNNCSFKEAINKLL